VLVIKKQVNTYNFKKISSRMTKEFGTIEKYNERNYAKLLFPIESNLLKINRIHNINSGSRADEAICMCLLMIDGYINRVEYDLDPYISDTNKPFLSALLTSFDPFSNARMMPYLEGKYDMQSREGLIEYFEAPVKCLLRIQKSIEFWTKEYGGNGYFNYLEGQIGEIVPHDDVMSSIIITWKEVDGSNMTMQDIVPDMSFNEVIMELFPGISKIFELGFIPSLDEIHEITREEYDAYQRQGGDISQELYTIIPKNYKYLPPSNEVYLLTHADKIKLGKAALFLYIYARDEGCKSQKSDDVLKFAAKRLPYYLTKGTRFERPRLHVLEPGEVSLTEREEVADLLAHVMGEGTQINITVTDRETNEVKKSTLPIKKHR
jgi:hypothetical protein